MNELHEKAEKLKEKLKKSSDDWKSHPSDNSKRNTFFSTVREVTMFTTDQSFWAIDIDTKTNEQILMLYDERLAISIDLANYLRGFIQIR